MGINDKNNQNKDRGSKTATESNPTNGKGHQANKEVVDKLRTPNETGPNTGDLPDKLQDKKQDHQDKNRQSSVLPHSKSKDGNPNDAEANSTDHRSNAERKAGDQRP
jgi:hypothetical protein